MYTEKDFENYLESLNSNDLEDVDSLKYLSRDAISKGMGFVGIINGELMMTNVSFQGVDKNRMFPEEDGDGWTLHFRPKTYKEDDSGE